MSNYKGSLTREQFMFREMRIVAQLYYNGSSAQEISQRVVCDNLFQYPTEREIKGKCKVALRRLGYIASSEALVDILANGAVGEAKQVALAAMMRDSLLLAEFMVQVIGEKYRQLDLTLTRKDLNLFFSQLCDKDAAVASWSPSTVKKIKAVLMNILRENGYLEGIGSETLLPVIASVPFLQELKALGLQSFFPAYNVLN